MSRKQFIYYPQPTDPDFYDKIYHKKEFYLNRQHLLSKETLKNPDDLCRQKEKFKLLPQQQFLKNLISPDTPYNNILVFWSTGVGKTLGALSVAEGFKDYIRTMNENGIPAKIYIISNTEAKNNFKDTLLRPCDKDNTYITPKECEELDELSKSQNPVLQAKYYEKEKRIYKRLSNKKYDGYYKFMSYKKFQNKTLGEFSHLHTTPSGKVKRKYRPPTKGAIKNIDHSILIVDEAHNITENDRGRAVEYIYKKSKNVRLVLMTATPMMHKAYEIVPLLKILRLGTGEHLQMNDIFEGPKFSKLKPDGLEKIKKISTGYVSYLRGLNPYSFPERIDEGVIPKFKSLPANMQLIYTPIVRCVMDNYQYATYKNNDNGKFNASIKNIVDIVYPNPERGSRMGIYDVAILRKLEGTPEGRKFLQKNGIRFIRSPGTDNIEIDGDFLNWEHIKKYSSKFYRLLVNLHQQRNDNVGKSFIYTNYVKTVGVFLIRRLLIRNGYEEFSFSKIGASSNPNTKCYYCGIPQGKHKKSRDHQYHPATFIALTGLVDKITSKQLIDQYNSPDNLYGKIIKIVIGSPYTQEAIDFKAIRTIHIMNYPKNYSTIEQIIGRGVRHCSHSPKLPKDKRNVRIYRYVASLPNPSINSIEEKKYIIGEKDHIVIKQVERALKENAVDCSLNKPQNIFEEEYLKYRGCEKKHKCNVQCDYQDCQYKCATPVKMDPRHHGLYPQQLTLKELDTSTYAAYPNYYQPEMNKIKKRVRKIFKQDVAWTLEQLKHLVKRKSLYLEDRFLYLALQEMIENKEPVTNFFGVPGTIIYAGKYYLFQPDGMDRNISVLERSQPSQTVTTQKVNVSDYLNTFVTETKSRFEKFDFEKFKKAIEKHSDPAKIEKIATKQDLKIQQDVLESAIESMLKILKTRNGNKTMPGINKMTRADFKTSADYAIFDYNRKILDAFKKYLILSDQLVDSTTEYSYSSSAEIMSSPDKTIVGHYLGSKPRCYNQVKNEWALCGKDIKRPSKANLKENNIVIGYLSKDRRNRIVFKLMIPKKEEAKDRRKRTRGFVCKQNNDKKILFEIAKKLNIDLKRKTQEYICDKIEVKLRGLQRKANKSKDIKDQYRWFYDYLEYMKIGKK